MSTRRVQCEHCRCLGAANKAALHGRPSLDPRGHVAALGEANKAALHGLPRLDPKGHVAALGEANKAARDELPPDDGSACCGILLPKAPAKTTSVDAREARHWAYSYEPSHPARSLSFDPISSTLAIRFCARNLEVRWVCSLLNGLVK
jgi:hypothetical protein